MDDNNERRLKFCEVEINEVIRMKMDKWSSQKLLCFEVMAGTETREFR